MNKNMPIIELRPWLKSELCMFTSQMVYYDINLLDTSEKPGDESHQLGYTMDNYLTNFIKLIKNTKPKTRHLLQVLALKRLKSGTVYVLTDGIYTIQASINERAKIKNITDSTGAVTISSTTQLTENMIIQVNRYSPFVCSSTQSMKLELGDIMIVSTEDKVKFRGQPLEENVEVRSNIGDLLHDYICLQCYNIKKNDIYKVANCILEQEALKVERELKRKTDNKYNEKYYENFDEFCNSINSFYSL